MTEQELRQFIAKHQDELPNKTTLLGWAKATGLTVKRVKDFWRGYW